MNIRQWNELALDEAGLDFAFERAVFAILYDVLGPARVRGVKDLEMFWIASVAKKAGPSSVLDLRYFPAKRKITCRLIVSPVGPAKGRALRYLADVERLTLEVLVGIEARLAKTGVTVDLAATRAKLSRECAKLARKNRRSTTIRRR